MEAAFWHQRWESGEIAFHEAKPHRFLRAHWDKLNLEESSVVFLPLCGKSLDIDWLLTLGHCVVGVELNAGAVEEVFARLGLIPQRDEFEGLERLRAGHLTVYVGDFFKLGQAHLGAVSGVFDRGALVALPDAMRRDYVSHLAALTPGARSLTVSYAYEEGQTQGPPFSVPFADVEALFAATHTARQIDSAPINGPLAHRCEGDEIATMLTPR